MDYKEKYEQALERAKKLQANAKGLILNKWLYRVFPELKESEDEKIRKEIIRIVNIWTNSCPTVNGIPAETLLDWLEKQSEKSNPYSGTSFEYSGHTWGMCARDNGVEILIDSKIKAFISLEKSFIYPQPTESTKVDNQNYMNSINKVEPKFKIGDWITIKE